MKSEIWITIVCASLLFVAPASAQQGSEVGARLWTRRER